MDRVLSPMLFSVYIDDLIRFLRHSGYGTYISSQFIGTILYADDITLLSGSCRGLQRMLVVQNLVINGTFASMLKRVKH